MSIQSFVEIPDLLGVEIETAPHLIEGVSQGLVYVGDPRQRRVVFKIRTQQDAVESIARGLAKVSGIRHTLRRKAPV